MTPFSTLGRPLFSPSERATPAPAPHGAGNLSRHDALVTVSAALILQLGEHDARALMYRSGITEALEATR